MLLAFSLFTSVISFAEGRFFTGYCNSHRGCGEMGGQHLCSYWQSRATSASSEDAQVTLVQPGVAAVVEQEQLRTSTNL